MAADDRSHRRPRDLPPLDEAGVRALALRYVERYATSEAKLVRFLRTKLRLRGWAGDGEPDLAALAARLADLGYVSDRSFAGARARGMAARGLGARRVGAGLRADGIGEEATQEALAEVDGVAAAMRFAARKRLGPWGAPQERKGQEKQLAAMLRAGHGMALSRAILRAETIEAAEAVEDS
ncbi:RecX family transcriptional regulator [Sandaracinobacteroides saxicola]|uniref:Regulatory protein RecX n=1 Tax=Sandaracinobacteroides saxicola TaxID=2759707 RepID=A0A7G5ILT1_9SPHN|nr:RecX family transcriptional regulator [Sandaracinobacteroides saxicola]QMW24323.1 RecX family transcriptional regulator [Sandaracinobacteroides saxicola]